MPWYYGYGAGGDYPALWPRHFVELRAAIVKMEGWVKAKNLKLKAQSHSVKFKSEYAAAWVQGLTGIVVLGSLWFERAGDC